MRLYENKNFFFLIVYFQTWEKVQLFVAFENMFQEKKQSTTMFNCQRKGTIIILVRQ